MSELIIKPEIKKSAYWSNMKEEDYALEENKIEYEIREEDSIYEAVKTKHKNPKVGDIWLVKFPRLEKSKNNKEIYVIEKRPFLIIDDKYGFVIEDKTDYHGLKITTKFKKKNRVEIKNWKDIGLKEKSFVRLSMPIKIEKEQLVFRITKISKEEVKYYASKITDILNMDNLNKLRKGENIYK